MEKLLQLEYSSGLNNIVDANESFDRAQMLVAYTGLNRNNSFISKEAFEKAIPSMYNVPVVANYRRTANGGEIGEHDEEQIKDKDGNKCYVKITQPVGVIPESANYDWVEIEDNGVMHEYLYVEVLLWKRQEAYQKIKDDGITKQSMEISVADGKFTNGYYQINDFEFTAFCLLGSAEPCFESAALFTNKGTDTFRAEFKTMMTELKDYYTNNPIDEKEVEKGMDKFEELLKQYNLSKDDIKFEYADMSDEELEAKFAEEFGDQNNEQSQEVENNDSDEDGGNDGASLDDEKKSEKVAESEETTESEKIEEVEEIEEAEDEFALDSNVNSQLCKIVSQRETIVEDYDGFEYSYPKYYLRDYDAEAKEVYYECYEADGGWIIYGAKYSFNGDAINIDFDHEKRKKIAIVDYDEGEKQEDFILEGLEKRQEAFKSAVEQKISKQSEEIEILNQYKNTIDNQEKDKLFESFDKQLSEVEEFKTIKENKENYSLEALEKELFALYGKVQMEEFACKEKEKNGSVRTLNNFNAKENVKEIPYGGLFERNGFKAKEDK